MRAALGIFLFVVIVCCGRISSARDQISNFLQPILNSSSASPVRSDLKEICDLSPLEIGDGEWMTNSERTEVRPMLLDFLWKHCWDRFHSP
ncbi:hypothetical protein CH367_03865 [Leptospira barantonii]|uniref:Uncharacterized protein n=1 Tax=Leptospira barantonii TaxID=2023184 RepID=A0ABX4NQP4_9LEPT|nr:hypothetical protein CH367_03865 [Leptospira barantonii]